MESQKNANLLNEYHELYELQRRRLEEQVHALSKEKEIWSAAAYSLALKVMSSQLICTKFRSNGHFSAYLFIVQHICSLFSSYVHCSAHMFIV